MAGVHPPGVVVAARVEAVFCRGALDAAYDGGEMSQTAWKVLLAGKDDKVRIDESSHSTDWVYSRMGCLRPVFVGGLQSRRN